jgi:pimeloyl-ACP methyl ester carboxylesterase
MDVWGEYTGISIEPQGPPQPHPILFVHGWWGGAWVWDRFMPFFAARGYPCYALNLRGNHGSKPVANLGKVSFADHLDDVRIVAKRLGNPIIIAHSAGGLLAHKLAEEALFPAVVALAPAAPRGVFALVSWTLLRLAIRYGPAMLKQEPFLPDKPTMVEIDLNRLPAAEQEAVYQRLVPAPGRQGTDVAILGVPINRAKIRSPLLIVAGHDDNLTPLSVVQATARKLGATLHEYPSHAHYLIREPGWEAIAHDIVQWLEHTITPAATRIEED